jgi:para-aminobenzoate synthetase/4-amino-4-deoxychorismate lyase
VPVPQRLGPRPAPRPDPARGIFETLLVRDGVAVAAERHLARLAASAHALYGAEPPADLAAHVRRAAAEQSGPCRLRIVLDADGGVALGAAPLPAPPDAPLTLRPVTVPGGLGPHKWRDRRLVDALEAAVAPAVPLLVDLDGSVLETTRSSVVALIGDTLVSPAADGRLLPGVTCARLLDAAAASGQATARRRLTLDELRAAREAYVCNALRGREAIGAIRTP